jgi:prolyl oligopeptidase
MVGMKTRTRKDEVIEVIHGVEVRDPYRWLEDQDTPETRNWLEQQEQYFNSVIGSIPGRDRISARLAELMKVDVVGIPRIAGNRYFFSKKTAGQELSVICMMDRETGEEKILADPHPTSPDYSIRFDIISVATDGKTLAYAARDGCGEEVSISIIDTDTGEIIDSLPRDIYFYVALRSDRKGFYYVLKGENGASIMSRVMGTPVSDDERVFGGDIGKDRFVFCKLSEDEKYLIIYLLVGASGTRTEVYCKNVENDGPVTTLVTGIDARFMGLALGDVLYLETDYNASNERIIKIDINNPEMENWKEIIPESSSIIENFGLYGGNICVNYLENVSSVLKLFQTDGTYLKNIPMPSPGTILTMTGEWKTSEIFYWFSAYHIPSTVYRYDMTDDSLEAWGGEKTPFNSDNFVLKQVRYKSLDDTEIPMYICHLKNLTPDPSTPALLTGYGGFGLSHLPSFEEKFAVWMENGGVLALPALRGGGEFGKNWHHAGMLEKKQNVFDDFISAAEWLINNNYTSPGKLAIFGRSNGGLLVGAVITQRPDLFKAVACGYPLLDMIRYHKFLFGMLWVSEYGSPDDPEHFRYLIKYSPYHNVKQGTEYPAVILISGDSDTRVDPLHARKMTALLQEATTGDNPVVLMYDNKSGHISTAKPVSRLVEDMTCELLFLMGQTGFPGHET